MIFLLIIIISGACVSAAEDNSTSQDSEEVSQTEEDTTGDEEIDLDVIYDDEPAADDSNDTQESHVSVNLSKHATGIPILALLIACMVPVLRRN